MPYITTSNSKRLIKSISLKEIEEISIPIYKKEIYFFAKWERARLKGLREFLRDPDNFSTQYYKPLEVKDTLRYIYPEKRPSYHKDNSCLRLKSNFVNFEVPIEIQEKGEDEVKEFRIWFVENMSLIEDDIIKFIFKMQAQFRITREIIPESIKKPNSGVTEKENYNVQDLEHEIDEILREAGRFYWENPDKQTIIKRFGKLTFLAFVKGNIFNNDTGLNDIDLKEFLKMYENKFKKPVKDLLVEYYRILYNPEMTFSGLLLDKLNFRPCGHCLGIFSDDDEDINSSE